MFLNTSPVINITEGESVTLETGLDGISSTGTRGEIVALIRTESGSALGKE